MKNMHSKCAALSLAALISSVAACAAEQPETNTDATKTEPTLIARVKVGSGSVSYYEPEPGSLLEVETGDLEQIDALQGDDLSFSERFEFLSGEQAPQRLVEAEKRAAADRGQAAVSESGGSEGAKLSSIDKGYGKLPEDIFIGRYCQQQDRWFGSTFWTGDSDWWGRGLNYFKAGIYAQKDSIVAKITWTGKGGPTPFPGPVEPNPGNAGLGDTLVLKQGEFAGYRYTSAVDRSASTRVWSPIGPVYHHCVNFHF